MNESCPFYMNNQVVYSFGLHESSQNIYQMIFNKTGIQTAIFFLYCVVYTCNFDFRCKPSINCNLVTSNNKTNLLYRDI